MSRNPLLCTSFWGRAKNNLKMVKKFTKRYDINARGVRGATPLYLAIMYDASDKVLQYMLDQGADDSAVEYKFVKNVRRIKK